MSVVGKGGASAPGKMLIAGEYVVLTGSPALVAAVQTRATAHWTAHPGEHTARPLSDPAPRFPEAAASREEAEKTCGAVAGELAIDVSALRGKDVKLGLGSSAAAAAAAAAAVFTAHGEDLNDEAVRRAILTCALAGHETVAPRGSGVDVAASVMGGFLCYVREPLHVEAVDWPADLGCRIVWTGKEASTRALLQQLAEFRERAPADHDEALEALRTAMAALVQAFGEASVVPAAREAHRALHHLARKSGAPIVEETLTAIAELAESHGGAAKGSGAGGGDVALAFFEDSAEAFDAAIEASPYTLLDVPLGGPGVRSLPS
ncbi:MAG: hypothetical protein AAF645_28550 [Myxococcota bacterium]